MPASPPLLDVNSIDWDRIVVPAEEIREIVPQRHEFEMLDGIVHLDREDKCAAAIKEIRGDDFWVRGHIPGKPLFPGVLMIEASAQLCAYTFCQIVNERVVFAFGGTDAVRFRGQVVPGDRLQLVCKSRRMRRRMGIYDTQGFVNGNMVFEAVITGASMPA